MNGVFAKTVLLTLGAQTVAPQSTILNPDIPNRINPPTAAHSEAQAYAHRFTDTILAGAMIGGRPLVTAPGEASQPAQEEDWIAKGIDGSLLSERNKPAMETLATTDPAAFKRLTQNIQYILENPSVYSYLRSKADSLLADASSSFPLPKASPSDSLRDASILPPLMAFHLKTSPLGDMIDLGSVTHTNPSESPRFRWGKTGGKIVALVQFRDELLGVNPSDAQSPFPWADHLAAQGFAIASSLPPNEFLKLVAMRSRYRSAALKELSDTGHPSVEDYRNYMQAFDSIVYRSIYEARGEVFESQSVDSARPIFEAAFHRLKQTTTGTF